MNIFGFLTKLNNKKSTKGWVETSARFTGRYEQVMAKTKGSMQVNYNSYELVYIVKGKEKHGWYSFYPLPDPDPAELKDTTLHIRYKESRSYKFEPVLEEQK